MPVMRPCHFANRSIFQNTQTRGRNLRGGGAGGYGVGAAECGLEMAAHGGGNESVARV